MVLENRTKFGRRICRATVKTDWAWLIDCLQVGMEVAGGGGNAAGQAADRGTKRAREEDQSDQERVPNRQQYDTNADADDVQVEVTSGEGFTLKLKLPPSSTVLAVKQAFEHAHGIAPRDACVFAHDDSHPGALGDGETLGSLRGEKGALVQMSLLVEKADAQQVVPDLAPKADVVLGDGHRGDGDEQFNYPLGAVFVPAYPDWLVTIEMSVRRIKITNIQTSAVICKFGEGGGGEGQFHNPQGVTVTSDSSLVVVADTGNHRVQILRLIVGADRATAHLEFVRIIGNRAELHVPRCLTLLPGREQYAEQTVLVSDTARHSVVQYALDGTFVGIFVGPSKGKDGDSDKEGGGEGEEYKGGDGDGEFNRPRGITVLTPSSEVAFADEANNRIQIFDRDGKYKRQFGSYCSNEALVDGQFYGPSAIASDAHGNLLVTDLYTNRLQVFSPEGKHLCTRGDLDLSPGCTKAVAWSPAGDVAIANASKYCIKVWCAAA
jgi:tripartite motif-containing protein 2/3